MGTGTNGGPEQTEGMFVHVLDDNTNISWGPVPKQGGLKRSHLLVHIDRCIEAHSQIDGV